MPAAGSRNASPTGGKAKSLCGCASENCTPDGPTLAPPPIPGQFAFRRTEPSRHSLGLHDSSLYNRGHSRRVPDDFGSECCACGFAAIESGREGLSSSPLEPAPMQSGDGIGDRLFSGGRGPPTNRDGGLRERLQRSRRVRAGQCLHVRARVELRRRLLPDMVSERRGVGRQGREQHIRA